MVIGSMAETSPTFTWGITWGYNPLILTFDPNFLGHSSTCHVPRIFTKSQKQVDVSPIMLHQGDVLKSSEKCWYTWDGTLNNQPHIHLI